MSKIYIYYRQIFDDSYDRGKCAFTPTKLCRTRFGLFKDSVLEDHRDAISIDGETSGSDDKVDETNDSSGVNVSNTTSSSERKSSSGKKKKIFARELSFLVDHATSAAKKVAAKIKYHNGFERQH